MNGKLFREAGRFIYDLGRVDLAYIGASITLPITMTVDIVDYTSMTKENPLRRTIGVLEKFLRFSKREQK